MSKRQLSVESITNELEGASLFFKPSPAQSKKSSGKPRPNDSQKAGQRKSEKPREVSKFVGTIPPRHRDTMLDTMTPRYYDTMLEVVRKAVKEFGKEAATHRFTEAEKRAVADIIYAYRGRGIRTSENEIARIAVNFLVQDYRENGENSLLEKVLKLLHE